MTSIRLALATIFLSASFNTFAKPLNFHSVDWLMSVTEILSAFKSKGYACKTVGKDSRSVWLCNGDFEGQIELTDAWVEFPIDSINGRFFSTTEILDRLEERYKIKPVYERWALPELEIEQYLWSLKGKDGDYLNLYLDDRKNFVQSIRLYKGRLGEKLDF